MAYVLKKYGIDPPDEIARDDGILNRAQATQRTDLDSGPVVAILKYLKATGKLVLEGECADGSEGPVHRKSIACTTGVLCLLLQVERTAEALNQGGCSGLCHFAREAGLTNQVCGKTPIDSVPA